MNPTHCTPQTNPAGWSVRDPCSRYGRAGRLPLEPARRAGQPPPCHRRGARGRRALPRADLPCAARRALGAFSAQATALQVRRRTRRHAGAHAGRGGRWNGGATGVGAGPGPAVAGVDARSHLRDGRAARCAGLAAVGAGRRLPLEHGHVQCGSAWRAPRRAPVGACERLRLGRVPP